MAHSLNAVPVDKLENFLVCPICKDILKDPRTLPNCFHSYCRTCLETFVKNVRDEAPSGRRIREFNCPICRNPFTLNPEDKVEDMGRSHFIYNMLEVMAVDQHRVKGVPCTHCERPSVGRCITCEAFLCQECLKIHNSFLGFQDHVVLSMDELSKPENQKKVRGKPHCREHKEKTLKFYCETCQELICRRCMDFNHNKAGHSCLAVEDVAEKEKQILVSNSAALEGKLLEGKNALKKVMNAKQSLEKVKEQTKRDINQRKDNLLKELTRQLNDQVQHLLKEVEEIYVGKHNTLVQQEAQVKGYVEKLESCASLSKGLLEKGTDEEILSSTKMMKSNIEKLQNETPKKVEPVDEDVISYKCYPINLSKISVISEEMGRVTSGQKKKRPTLRELTCDSELMPEVSNEANSIIRANKKIPSEKLSCSISNRVKLLVYQGDITEDDADAIVNPANENLQHVGGAALAILNRGGRSIQSESDNIMKRREHKPLCPGDVEVTSSGNLPCNFVVHAVGPRWRNHRGESDCRKLLKKAVLNSLSMASDNGAQTIAIPAISSGVFGVPIKICAEVLFTSVKEYVNGTNGPVRLTEIRFVNIDEPTVKVFVQEMKRRYGSSIIPSYSEAARNSSKPQNDQASDSGPQGFWIQLKDESKNTR